MQNRLLWFLAFSILAGGFAYYASSHPMDFRVYHYGARGVFDGTRPVYGLTSGLGWPMHYRYPPLFLLLFAPFAWMPIGIGAAIWVILKFSVLSVPLLKGDSARSAQGVILTVLIAAPYLIEDFRYGNVQFFIFALTAASLLIARERPVLSAASLALAISIKVWPLFFAPYLVVKRQWQVLGWTACFTLLLTLLPSLYFGFSGNLNLLGEWFNQEFRTQLGESEIWFPNQSLRGVLMRYLTVIDYSQIPDSNYPGVNMLALDPSIVRILWLILAGIAYAGFLFLVLKRRHENNSLLELAIGFCLLALLQPFTQKYALSVLLLPAFVVSQLVKDKTIRLLVYTSIVLILIQPFTPGPAAQRLLQVLGFDFVATVFLTAALAVSLNSGSKTTDTPC